MGFLKKTIRDVSLDNQTVLVRVDYNVPLAADGTISDDLRIQASVPTIQYLLERGCKVVLISHLGRPDGHDPALSLEQMGIRLGEILGRDVIFVDDLTGDDAYQTVRRAAKKSVILLQNLRYYPEEEADDETFAKAIVHASQAAYFVQDGFGVVHRAHASTHAVTLLIPSVSGLLLEREFTTITDAMENPKRPLIAVMGGAKVSDKIGLVERFVDMADNVLIGGAMANTFLAYKGYSVGASKVETDQAVTLDNVYAAARAKVGESIDDFVVLPLDVAVAQDISPELPRTERQVNAIQSDEKALDIGSGSIDRFCTIIENAGTVIWNGTMGMAELPNFAHGSARIALTLAMHPNVTSIIGGGDTADFVLKWDAKKGESFTHVSTGGGASLDLMAGKTLPGVASLLDAS